MDDGILPLPTCWLGGLATCRYSPPGWSVSPFQCLMVAPQAVCLMWCWSSGSYFCPCSCIASVVKETMGHGGVCSSFCSCCFCTQEPKVSPSFNSIPSYHATAFAALEQQWLLLLLFPNPNLPSCIFPKCLPSLADGTMGSNCSFSSSSVLFLHLAYLSVSLLCASTANCSPVFVCLCNYHLYF